MPFIVEQPLILPAIRLTIGTPFAEVWTWKEEDADNPGAFLPIDLTGWTGTFRYAARFQPGEDVPRYDYETALEMNDAGEIVARIPASALVADVFIPAAQVGGRTSGLFQLDLAPPEVDDAIFGQCWQGPVIVSGRI